MIFRKPNLRYFRIWRVVGIFSVILVILLFSADLKPQEFASDEASETKHEIHTHSINRPWRHVCIIGNAQKEADAIRSHSMWDNQYVSLWFVWGEILTTPADRLPSNLSLVQTKDKKTWAQGIEYLIQIMSAKFECEYIFTHDDDLQFGLQDGDDKTPLHTVLTNLLLKYQPAIAGFPWPVGDQTVEGMKSMNEAYKHSEVAPLTGFDSGMILYHKSIVDFFIPYTPRGEGGFSGHWSLCAHFINLFAPHMLQESAIRINSIRYINLISFDNVPENARKPTKVSKNGLIVHAESRHPYEYHINAPFKVFLSNGLLNKRQRWGRDMNEYDITWAIEPVNVVPTLEALEANPDQHQSVEKWTAINRIANFYDLHHPILSKNAWIRSHFSDSELQFFLSNRALEGEDFYFVIHIFTLNRKRSLDQLWASINRANRIKRKVSIVIHLDTVESDNNTPFFYYIQHIQSLVSKHGSVTISINSKNKGLKQSILDSWTPSSLIEYGIFLEDDVSVSRHFLEYSEQMVARYLYPRGSQGYSLKCIGISLYNQGYDEVNEKDWKISTGPNYNPYILQQPQSWGAIYSPSAWNDFKKWFLAQSPSLDPLIPDSLTNRWLKTKSWKKYLLRYIYTKGKFMIYPNFPGQLSLSTNRLEVGTNDKIAGPTRKLMLKRFNVPLLDLDEKFGKSLDVTGIEFLKKVTIKSDSHTRLNLFADSKYQTIYSSPESIGPLQPNALIPDSQHLIPMSSMKTYDVHFLERANISSLMEGTTPKSFDKCTLLLNIEHNESMLIKLLEHYHKFSLLDSIIILWNSKQQPPQAFRSSRKLKPNLEGFDFNISAELVENISDIVGTISTDCIISITNNSLASVDELTFAIRLFQGHFYKNLIGFSSGSFIHKKNSQDQWDYLRSEDGRASLLDSSVLLYHRKYLEQEANFASAIQYGSCCRNVLLNLIVANASRMGPVVIESTHEQRHISTIYLRNQSHCLNHISTSIFNDENILKYTSTVYSVPKSNGPKDGKNTDRLDQVTPSLKSFKFTKDLE